MIGALHVLAAMIFPVLQMGADPAAVPPFRYQPEGAAIHSDGADIVIANGKNRFNRPLYGSNTIFFVYAGDLPEIMMALPGKGGTLRLGIAAGANSKWLSEAENVVARYCAGAMRYEIRDPLLGTGAITIDVVPMAEAEGAIVQVAASADAAPVDLICAFGGASMFMKGAWNFDTARYVPESALLFAPEDCAQNAFTLHDTGFVLTAPCHESRPVAGTTPPGATLKLAEATAIAAPNALWQSTAAQLPILTGRRALAPGETTLLALERLKEGGAPLKPEQLPEALATAEKHRAEIADRVHVATPDPYINASVPALCAAADGLWEPPTYAHGGVAWHMPYLGWRGAYIASEFGWNDRAKQHFRTFAALQVKEPASAESRMDPKYNFARQAADAAMNTRGCIPYMADKSKVGEYDMQEVYIDQLLWHLLWTGDREFANEMWPVLEAHLGWEKRCFDADDDGLYENYANTLISDAHHYSGGACTQASAYDYRALRMAARLAQLLGKDPAPFQQQAEKTLAAMNRDLWMPALGWYAEYRDYLGLKRLHPSAELPSIYHPIDSDLPDMFQAYQMLRYVNTAIEHVPVEGKASVLWASNWVPYIWSTRNILASEVAHTALAAWQAGQRDIAWNYYRGAILDAMYAGRVPGNCAGTSEHDGRWGGACSDFCCSVGMFGRALVEGLFGIVPNMLDGELVIRPGFPPEWASASLDTPDVGYTYTRTGETERFDVRAKFAAPARLRLRVPARAVQVAGVLVNGQQAEWKCVPAITEPAIEILAPQADGAAIEIQWQGEAPVRAQVSPVAGLGDPFAASFGAAAVREINDPQVALKDAACEGNTVRATVAGQLGHRTAFARVEQGALTWWAPMAFEIRPPVEFEQAIVNWEQGKVEAKLRVNTTRAIDAQAQIQQPTAGLVPGTNPIAASLGEGLVAKGAAIDWRPPANEAEMRFECVDLTPVFNDRVSQIFKHEYRSPRSPFCSLQIPMCGYGDWCYGDKGDAPKIDDSAIRAAAGAAGRFTTPQGIPFATPGPGEAPNIVFTSQWDNFPKEVTVPLAGKARHAYFLVAGSTHPMHSQLDNGELVVTYADGQTERLALHNPTTWWPIEGDYDLNVDAFCVPPPHPPRIELGSGRATLLDLPLDPARDLQSITVRCLANEVVVGLMGVTLSRLP